VDDRPRWSWPARASLAFVLTVALLAAVAMVLAGYALTHLGGM
jgi:hypothetical protein